MSRFHQNGHLIETIFLDVDGVLTDGGVFVTSTGEQLRTMNIKDGYALQWAVKQGIHICIISGGKGTGVQSRLEGLGIQHIYTGIKNKIECLQQHVQDHQLDVNTSLYMGDDIPDVQVMKACHLKVCPADAAAEVLEIADYISPIAGGKGCVRDVVEKVMRMKGIWDHPEASMW